MDQQLKTYMGEGAEIQEPCPVKDVRKALESLIQKLGQSVRDFALEVEDVLAEFITVSSVGMSGAQRTALASDRKALPRLG